MDSTIEYLESVIKDFGEPIALREIAELTKDVIEWKPVRNRSAQMKKFVEQSKHIKSSSKFGKYEYTDAKEDDSMNERLDIVDLTKDNRELLDKFREHTKEDDKCNHKCGDTVEGFVSGIEPYGVFVENDDKTVHGLVHITNVRNHHVDDLERHFKVGDVIKAKVEGVKQDGKLALSTKEFDLPNYFENTMADKLEPVRENIKPRLVEGDSKEVKQIFEFIQKKTGVVSENAKDKIRELLRNHGMFSFMLTLAEESRDFDVDLSMIFAKELEKKLSDGL